MGANISRRASTMKEILQQEQKQKQKQKQQQALTSVGGTIPEAGGAPRGIASVNVLATSRRSSSVTSMGARISRRASTMKEMLQQQQKQTQKQQLQQQQQPVKPIGKNNRIQMERQQRRNRGLNLGWVDTSFFSLTSIGYPYTSTMLLNPEVVYFTPGQWAAPPSSVSICICVVYILDVYSSQRNPPQNLLGSLVIALCCLSLRSVALYADFPGIFSAPEIKPRRKCSGDCRRYQARSGYFTRRNGGVPRCLVSPLMPKALNCTFRLSSMASL